MFKSPLHLLKKTNHEQLLELAVEDQKLIAHIMKRMSVVKINSIDAQIIQRDLIGMAMELKSRGSSLAVSLGDEASDFADAVYKNSGGANWLEFILNYVLRLSGYFFVWFLTSSLLLYGGFTWQANTSVYPIFAMVVTLSFVLDLWITPRLIMKAHHLPSIIAVLTLVIVTAVFMRFTDQLETVVIHAWPVIGVSAVVFVIAQVMQNLLMRKIANFESHLIEDL